MKQLQKKHSPTRSECMKLDKTNAYCANAAMKNIKNDGKNINKTTMTTKIENTLELCGCEDEEITLANGFEDAFLGIASQFNRRFAVYDRAKCIEILAKDMSYDEAEEYFQFNVEGAWVGESTPAFMCFERE